MTVQTYDKRAGGGKVNRTSDLTAGVAMNNDTLAELCHDLVWPARKKDTSVFSLEEFASIIRTSERHARRYLAGEIDFSAEQYIALEHAAFWRGDRRLLNYAVPRHHDLAPFGSHETNEEVSDEVSDLVKFEGRMTEAFERGALDEAAYWNAKGKEALLGIDCEIANKKAKK